MHRIDKIVPFLAAAVAGLIGVMAALVLLETNETRDEITIFGSHRPVWTEVQWPFPPDLWGKGKAFRCGRADCGSEVNLYFRAKLGFCNCATGMEDDTDLDRKGDLDLVGQVSPLGAGRPIMVGSMPGRSRAYALALGDRQRKTAISLAFNERCDMVAVTVVLQHDRPEAVEPAVVEFLNSRTVLSWTEVNLGL